MAEAPRGRLLFDIDTLAGLREAMGEAMVGAARAAGPAGSPPGEAAARACERAALAVAYADAGRMDEARAVLLVLIDESNDLRLLFLAYQFFFRTGDYDLAERCIRRRLDVARPQSIDAARAWNNFGLLQHVRGDAADAERMLRRALEIDTRLGHDEGIARDLGNLALIPEARGDLDEAERLTRESLAIGERIGFAPLVAGKLCNLGEIALARGGHAEARGLLERAAAAFRALGDDHHREHCERLIGEIDRREPGPGAGE